jgi:CBS domain-containing protein
MPDFLAIFAKISLMSKGKISSRSNIAGMHTFMRAILTDVEALEHMLEHDWFETDPIHIGAEQEMCLVDRATLKPKPIAMEVLERMPNCPWLDTELARFNLEINLQPRRFATNCLAAMEAEIHECLRQLRRTLHEMDADLILTGILPTIRKHDLERHNLTPRERYELMIDAFQELLQGEAFEFRLRGIDEIQVRHESPLLEACNTSFQVHLQVNPHEFADFYNTAQALAGPILAAAANSPIVFGRRLWHESRIALFQQALDIRSTHDHLRERSPRVSFGNGWVRDSVLEIYREDLARFRALICMDLEEDTVAKIQRGETPSLRALQVHNSTIYRWNRPCYGISASGKPHLRIENRVLPAGPTVIDQMANTAFWLGAMIGLQATSPRLTQRLDWEDARSNFEKAAAFGIESQFTWLDGHKHNAPELILEELLPLARLGLELKKVNEVDIDRLLGVIQERVKKHTNGALWQLQAYTKLHQQTREDEALLTLSAALFRNQQTEKPVHEWPLPEVGDLGDYQPAQLRVEEFMETDLFTVQKDDLIELVAQMMDWKRIRYLPVEDKKGRLSGLITSRLVLRHFARQTQLQGQAALLVEDIMIANPITISPQTPILEAVRLMRDRQIGCLPVVQDNELVGIITEMDFLSITARLIERG